MANPELGAKQICPNCQAKFYDLGRRPATCPKCGTQFDPEEAVKNRRIRARTATPDYETDEDEDKPAAVRPESEEGFEDEPDETREIDEAADEPPVESDDGDVEAAAGPADDLSVDFVEDDVEEAEDDDAVPFLEDEDDDFADEEIEGLPGDEDGEH